MDHIDVNEIDNSLYVENIMVDHYLTYLKDIINLALKNYHYLFSPDACNDLTLLLSLDEDYLKILSRIIKRKGPWLRYTLYHNIINIFV